MDSLLSLSTSSLRLMAVDGASAASLITVHDHDPKSEVRHVRWSPSGDCLVSTMLNSSDVLLTYHHHNKKKKTAFTSVPVRLDDVSSMVSTACVVQKDKLALTSDSKLLIYDIGRKRTMKHFDLHYNNVSAMDTDTNASTVFIGSQECNAVCSVSLNTHTLSKNFNNAYSNEKESDVRDGITCLRYNRLMLVTSSGRSVTLYDVRSSSALKSFEVHMAPTTSVAFSPLNPSFLLSTGLDKKCIGYDTRERKAVCIIPNERPLKAVEALKDGKTIVVGDTRGKIELFDLREFSKPIRELQIGQETPINAIVSCPKKFKMSSQTTKGEEEEGGRSNKENWVPNKDDKANDKDDEKDDSEETSYVFSPVHNNHHDLSSMSSRQAISAATASFMDYNSSRQLSIGSSKNTSVAKTADLSLFSPLQQPVNELSALSVYSPFDPTNEAIANGNKKMKQSTPAMSPLIIEPVRNNDEHQVDKEVKSKETFAVEASTSKVQQPQRMQDQEECGIHEVPSDNMSSSTTTTFKAVLQAFPTCITSNAEAVEVTSPTQDVRKSPMLNCLSREEEAIEDLRDLVLKMHFDMRYHVVEMFHEQQKMFREIAREVVHQEAEFVNQELLQEVNRLRKENEELKKYF